MVGDLKDLYIAESIEELQGKVGDIAKYKDVPNKHKFKTASAIFVKAREADLAQDEEGAFVYYMRSCDIWSLVEQSNEFAKDKKYWRSMYSKDYGIALDRLEAIKPSLKKRYELKSKGGAADIEKSQEMAKSNENENITETLIDDVTMIKPADLYRLMKNSSESTKSCLVIDIRSIADYEANHIKMPRFIDVISIPNSILRRGIVPSNLEPQLDEAMRPYFANRHSYAQLVLMDWDSDEMEGSDAVDNLMLCLTKWDQKSAATYGRPLFLEGGFNSWLLQYNTCVSDPYKHVARQKVPNVPTKLPNVNAIRYGELPDIDNKEKDAIVDDKENVLPPATSLTVMENPLDVPHHYLRQAIDRSTKPKAVDMISERKQPLSMATPVNDVDLADDLGAGKSEQGVVREGELLAEIERLQNELKKSGHNGDELQAKNNELNLLLEARMKPKPLESASEDGLRVQKDEIKEIREDVNTIEEKEPVKEIVAETLPEKPAGDDESSKAPIPPVAPQPIVDRSRKPRKEDESAKSVVDGRQAPQPAAPTVNVDRKRKPTAAPASDVNRNSRNTVNSHVLPNFDPLRLSPEAGSIKPGLVGFRNLGNTCYMNSIIQCLSNCFMLRSSVLNNGEGEYNLGVTKGRRQMGFVALELSFVFRAAWSGHFKVLSMHQLRLAIIERAPLFNNFAQHDAHEFFNFVLDFIHDDLNKWINKPKKPTEEKRPVDRSDNAKAARIWNNHQAYNDSVVVKCFHGLLRSSVNCMTCKEIKTQYDVFNCLSLPVPNRPMCSISECFALYCQTELIDGYRCARCNKSRQVSKKIDLYKVPPILVLHLNRFSFNGNEHEKLKTSVSYPLEMTVGEHEYYLTGVSCHLGKTMESGHYIALARNHALNQWFKFDDSSVSTIHESSVQSRDAYLLFYSSSAFLN